MRWAVADATAGLYGALGPRVHDGAIAATLQDGARHHHTQVRRV